MDKKKELARNTLILTIGNICTRFVGFLLIPIYTVMLKPDEFGIVDLFSTYVALLVPMFNWQLENGLFRFMIDYRNNFHKLRVLCSTVAITNIIQIVCYVIFYFAIQSLISSEYKVFLLYDVVMSIVLNMLLQFSRGLGKTNTYSLASFMLATFTVLLNIFFIISLKMGAYGLFWATIVAKIITNIFLIFKLKVWNYIVVKMFDYKELMMVFRYSIPLVPNSLSWWIVDVSDRSIITFFLGVSLNGIYSIANKFSSVYITLYNIFHLAWTESASLHINDADKEIFLNEIINKMFKLLASMCLFVINLIPFVFTLIIDNQYCDSYYQIPILMLAGMCQAAVGLYSVIYIALKDSVEILKTSVLAAMINIISNVLMIGWIGLYAASLSTLLAYLSMLVYRYVHIRKSMNVYLSPKILLITFGLSSMSLYTYYSTDLLIKYLMLILTIIVVIIWNKEFIAYGYKLLRSKMILLK